MLNAIGLQNIGIHKVIDERRRSGPNGTCPSSSTSPVIPSKSSRTWPSGWRASPGVAGIELNISCPNVWEGGRVVGEDAATTSAITEAVRSRDGPADMVKLSPQVADIVGVAQAAEDAGADAISLINTFVGMKIDTRTARSGPRERDRRPLGACHSAAWPSGSSTS